MKGPMQLVAESAAHEPEIAGMLVSPRVGTFLQSAGLPRGLGDIQGASIIFARKGRMEEDFTVATITSFEVSMRRKNITLHLSAPRFLAGKNPILWFANGVWHVSVKDEKEYIFDDIELKVF